MSPKKNHDVASNDTHGKAPKLVEKGKDEDEIKIRVLGQTYDERMRLLKQIFYFVSKHPHFSRTNQMPHISGLPEKMRNWSDGISFDPKSRERDYWATAELTGYMPGDPEIGELRTEEKLKQGWYEQTFKPGSTVIDGRLIRGEYKSELKTFGINLSKDTLKKDKAFEAAQRIFGKKTRVFKPLIHFPALSQAILYHPEADERNILEIKFDGGESVDIYYEKDDLIELEIEMKGDTNHKALLADMIGQSKTILYNEFGGALQPITVSKVSEQFTRLAGRRLQDPERFAADFASLPGTHWTTIPEMKPLRSYSIAAQ